MNQKKIFIYDTTLRDGEQGANISFSLNDKLQVALKLDQLGVDYIEGGWPNPTNPKTLDFFKQAESLDLTHAKLSAFGSTRMAKNKVTEEPMLQWLLQANTPVVTIFGKTWDLHVNKVLNTSLKENLLIIRETVAFLKSHNKEVIFDAEHFFDGFKHNPDYALQCLSAAYQAGADCIALADTNGGSLPSEVAEICQTVRQEIPISLGIHTHNDMETAVANSIAAIQTGFDHVQGTMNGFGERCGNANLISIIPILSLKLDLPTIPTSSIAKLTETSHAIYEIASIPPNINQPFVGQSAFAHKAGVHANAIIKESKTYEHINPDLVGNIRHILVSEQAGASSLISKAEELGFKLEKNSPFTTNLLQEIKTLEYNGYEFDGAEASLKLFLLKSFGQYNPFFNLEGNRTIVEQQHSSSNIEVTMKIKVNEIIEHTAADGVGPVNALDLALRKALSPFYPEVNQMKLIDYKVRVTEGSSGTYSSVKVFIRSSDAKETWCTIGVSPNIIEASWIALVDSIEYKLLKERRQELFKEQILPPKQTLLGNQKLAAPSIR